MVSGQRRLSISQSMLEPGRASRYRRSRLQRANCGQCYRKWQSSLRHLANNQPPSPKLEPEQKPEISTMRTMRAGSWTRQEILRLREGVRLHGSKFGSFVAVARHVGTRTNNQVTFNLIFFIAVLSEMVGIAGREYPTRPMDAR